MISNELILQLAAPAISSMIAGSIAANYLPLRRWLVKHQPRVSKYSRLADALLPFLDVYLDKKGMDYATAVRTALEAISSEALPAEISEVSVDRALQPVARALLSGQQGRTLALVQRMASDRFSASKFADKAASHA